MNEGWEQFWAQHFPILLRPAGLKHVCVENMPTGWTAPRHSSFSRLFTSSRTDTLHNISLLTPSDWKQGQFPVEPYYASGDH